jgi:hypothetical protein
MRKEHNVGRALRQQALGSILPVALQKEYAIPQNWVG